MYKYLAAFLLLNGCFSALENGTGNTGDPNDTDDTDGTESGSTSASADVGGSGDVDLDMGTQATPEAVLRYDFDGNCDDSIGDADCIPVGVVSFVESPNNEAAAFSASYVDASAYNLAEHLSTISISIRYRANTTDGFRSLVALGAPGEDTLTNTFQIRIKDGLFEVVTETGAGVDVVADLGEAPDASDIWHHVVFVFQDTMASLYIDGMLHKVTSYVPAETTSMQLWIAGSWTMHWFDGAIDSIEIYEQALDADDLLNL